MDAESLCCRIAPFELPGAFTSGCRVENTLHVRDVERRILGNRQSGAPHHAVNDSAILDPPKGDRVLLVPEEALCPVNRVKGPVSAG